MTAETSPHYLQFDAEQVPAGATEFKCAPPIRGAAISGNGASGTNRDDLWRALQEGVIDSIVSAHAPCPPAMRAKETGDFLSAWAGITSLELGFAVVWSEMRRRGLTLDALATWMSEQPARIAGLQRLKGRIAPGFQADFALVEPNQYFEVTSKTLQQRHPVAPYLGRTLHGKVLATFVRGALVYADGNVIGAPTGQLLARPA